jgi:hypothetical protein
MPDEDGNETRDERDAALDKVANDIADDVRIARADAKAEAEARRNAGRDTARAFSVDRITLHAIEHRLEALNVEEQEEVHDSIQDGYDAGVEDCVDRIRELADQLSGTANPEFVKGMLAAACEIERKKEDSDGA